MEEAVARLLRSREEQPRHVSETNASDGSPTGVQPPGSACDLGVSEEHLVEEAVARLLRSREEQPRRVSETHASDDSPTGVQPPGSACDLGVSEEHLVEEAVARLLRSRDEQPRHVSETHHASDGSPSGVQPPGSGGSLARGWGDLCDEIFTIVLLELHGDRTAQARLRLLNRHWKELSNRHLDLRVDLHALWARASLEAQRAPEEAFRQTARRLGLAFSGIQTLKLPVGDGSSTPDKAVVPYCEGISQLAANIKGLTSLHLFAREDLPDRCEEESLRILYRDAGHNYRIVFACLPKSVAGFANLTTLKLFRLEIDTTRGDSVTTLASVLGAADKTKVPLVELHMTQCRIRLPTLLMDALAGAQP